MLNRNNDNRPGYTGHVVDKATGLVYMQQRYYDPQVGRFLSVDPVTAYEQPTGAFNRYRYANNNPYRFTDPDGRWVEDLAIGIPSLIMGANSFANNVSQGNLGSAVVDAVGMAVDVAGIATPGIPGGAGAAIGVVRGVDRAVDTSKAARAGHNGVEGPVKLEARTTRAGEPAAKITYPDGSLKDVSPSRVKESVPQTHPNAPQGTMQKVKFEDAQPGSKGYKRDPTPDDLKDAGIRK